MATMQTQAARELLGLFPPGTTREGTADWRSAAYRRPNSPSPTALLR
jgi:hypothetical protein